MPILWKPWRRRKQEQRQQQPPVVSSSATESASGSIELPPSLQEVDEEEDDRSDIVFATVIQDFNRSAYDELSVRRGQMVQPLYNDGMWLYVRDIDCHCGYIPANFCSTLEEVKNIHWKTGDSGACRASRKVKPRQQSIHDLVRPTLHSSTSQRDSVPTTPAAAYLSSIQTSPRNNRTTSNSLTGTQPSAAEPNSRQELTPGAGGGGIGGVQLHNTSFNSPLLHHMLHPLHPLSFAQRHDPTSDHQRRLTYSSEETDRPGNPLAYSNNRVHGRNDSYQEAVVVDGTRNGYSLGPTPPQITIRRPSRPSHLPLCTTMHPYDHLESYQLDTHNKTTTEGLPTSSRNSQCIDDDVFLPTANKPQGIFRALDEYHRHVQGEVSVKKNEYVIVMTLGTGEWAGVITSSGAEGVIPKSILQRYTPHHSLSSTGTQTELMIVAPAVFSIGTGSSADHSQSTQQQVVSIREVPLTYRQRRRRRRRQSQAQQRTIETAIQTDAPRNPSSVSPPPQSFLRPQAWGSNNGNLENSFWYENSISIPRLPRNDCSSSQSIPSINSLVGHNNHCSEQNLVPNNHDPLPPAPSTQNCTAPPHSLLESETESLSSISSVEGIRNGIDKIDQGTPKRGEGKEESDSFHPIVPASAVEDVHINNHSSTSNPAQMIMLTAMRKFIPSATQRNSLPLKPGDILQLSPGENKVQDGWIWAFHTGLEMHGFVPHSHMAYLYLTPNKRIRNPSSLDDAV